MKVKQSIWPPVSVHSPMHGLVFPAKCGSQEQSLSSCAKTGCQDQITVDFSQLQKQLKKLWTWISLNFQSLALAITRQYEIGDGAQSTIIPAQNYLFCYSALNTCFSKSSMISLIKLGNPRPKSFHNQDGSLWLTSFPTEALESFPCYCSYQGALTF